MMISPVSLLTYVQWNLLTQKNVAQRFGQLLAELIRLLPIFLFDLLRMPFLLGHAGPHFAVALFLGRHLYVHDDSIGA
jgi:hypothetical protein